MTRLDRGHHDLTTLLLSWQSTSAECHLEELLRHSRELIEGSARQVLHRQRIDDPAAVDEAVSLVFDHLRRLVGRGQAGRAVAPFCPTACRGAGEPGTAYLVWLAKERARDVARKTRSRSRFVTPFSQFDGERHGFPEPPAAAQANDADAAMGDVTERITLLEKALERLEPPLAAVLRMLMQGKSQTAIATTLGVCEGTVSRMRMRAIQRVRALIRSE
jgi:RNA polymerase sigma factor (sigma-70 family)